MLQKACVDDVAYIKPCSFFCSLAKLQPCCMQSDDTVSSAAYVAMLQMSDMPGAAYFLIGCSVVEFKGEGK